MKKVFMSINIKLYLKLINAFHYVFSRHNWGGDFGTILMFSVALNHILLSFYVTILNLMQIDFDITKIVFGNLFLLVVINWILNKKYSMIEEIDSSSLEDDIEGDFKHQWTKYKVDVFVFLYLIGSVLFFSLIAYLNKVYLW